jgi:ABC-type Fe3+/spermidine/putrescine transport system ATPase subunit
MVRPEKLSLQDTAAANGEACMECAVEQRVYQGLSTVWMVRNAAGEAFTVYEQNDEPFDAAAVQSAQKMLLCWKPEHGVLIEAPR